MAGLGHFRIEGGRPAAAVQDSGLGIKNSQIEEVPILRGLATPGQNLVEIEWFGHGILHRTVGPMKAAWLGDI